MKFHPIFRSSFLLFLAGFVTSSVLPGGILSRTSAETTNASLPFVSPMFGDYMVLQRGKPVRFWGWAKPGETVRVVLDNAVAVTTVAADGRWQAEVRAPAPGGPYTVSISDTGQTAVLHEVLVGDVWLCGGQSNMQLGLGFATDGANEIKTADHPLIRLFTVKQNTAYAPALTPRGSWKVCSPQSVADAGGFSAVAYFFGRKLQDELHVPIGLIQDCLGGTPAESWMSAESLSKLKDFDAPLAEIKKLHAKGGPEHGSFLMHWLDEYDAGSRSNSWADAALDDGDWKTVRIPGGFSELGVADVPAICWFRKEVTLPDPLPAGPVKIELGSIAKMDTTYINGQWVGASSWVENPRAYFVKDGVLKPGRNVIAIRIFKLTAKGGFLGKPEALRLVLGDKSTIPLTGDWKGALSLDARPPHPLPLTFENYPTMPTVLFDGMIEPVAPLSIRGAIWYQGEANAERAHQYRTLLPAMIGDWRKSFHEGDFPFYIVSLPAFTHRRAEPGDDSWAELREAQAMTARTIKNSALAVTIDTGEADNIHPKDKKIVGERLAWCALANEYGKKIPSAGPTYSSVQMLPHALKIHFTHTDGGLVAKDGRPAEFSMAGKDRQWHWAVAKLDGDSVVVSCDAVPDPVAVRYAWQGNPAATLFNGAGFPAVPFRTDNWPGITDSHKPW